MLKVIYSKFSNDRCPDFAIRTDILRDENGVLYVQKCPMTEKAQKHTARMLENGKKLEELYKNTVLEPNHTIEKDGRTCFEFVEGETLSERLDSLLGKGDRGEFYRLFEQYAELVKTVSDPVQNPIINLDLIPDNILIRDEKWIVIDFEWTFEAEIPAEFILFRGIHYYVGYPKDSRMGLPGAELYEHFGFDEGKIKQYFEWEKKFQEFADGNYTKLETFKYKYNKSIVSADKVLAESEKREESYELQIVFYKDAEISREISRQIQTNHFGELEFREELQNEENEIRISFSGTSVLLHIKKMAARINDREVPLVFSSNGKSLGEFNVIRIKGEETLTASFEKNQFDAVDVVLECFYIPQDFKEALMWEDAADTEEKNRLTKRLQTAEKKNLQSDAVMDIVQLRQDQIRQLGETGSIRLLGSLMGRIKGHDPIRALRPKLNPEESGIRFFVDEVQYRTYGLFVRGWVFHNQGYPVFVRIRDEKDREIDVYIQKIKRDDVSDAFDMPLQSVRGFAFTIEKKDLKTEKIYLEFETLGGYISEEIMAFGRKKDRELWEKNQQDPSEYRMDYDIWAGHMMPDKRQLKAQRRHKFDYEPLISVVVPLFNTPLHFLEIMAESVLNQTYGNIQLCLADGSTDDSVENFVKARYGTDSRVKYQRLAENKGISGNTVEAVKLADGEFLMLCDHDDEVMPYACYEMVKALNEDSGIDAVYTDEDKMTMDGRYLYDPHFKPDFNLEFLRSNNYICHIFLVRKSIVDGLGEMFRSQFDGAQDYDFILRCCEKARKIYHVPKVCYHWRSHPLSTAGDPESKDYAYEAGRASVEAGYERAGIPAKVTRTEYFGRYRTWFEISGKPHVTVVAAAVSESLTPKQLHEFIRTLYDRTAYKEFALRLVWNESREDLRREVQSLKGTFRNLEDVPCSAANHVFQAYNIGAEPRKGTGDFLLFADASLVLSDENWMEEMLSYCVQENAGVCGAKILYPDGRIWHGGLVIGMGGGAGRLFDGIPADDFSYQGWVNSAREVSALSGVCMMVKEKLFHELGGFDEAVGETFCDADFCLRAVQKHYRNIYDPYAKVCYTDIGKKDDGADEIFRERWKQILEQGDPCYNRNLSLQDTYCNLKEL